MWRWPTVAGQKEASAKAKSKIYNIHSKLITIAAERGSDPSINSSLADAIHSAKREWVTSDVIDRAIRRGAGIDKDATKVEEVFYEGYAPGWVAIIVKALTDNRNRTAPSMRHIFSAFGGSLGETGSVSNFAFDYGGEIHVEKPADMDAFEMIILDTSAEDYRTEWNEIIIITARENYMAVKWAIEKAGYTVTSATIWYRPKNYIEVTEMDNALKIYKMLEEFEADEDVETVWNTADISDELWKEVTDFVQSKKFRT
jgi:YebC/PmpR family DNA-binding regulatory protein